MRTLIVLCIVGGLASAAMGDDYGWAELSLSTCKVDEFIADHPASDGRGVVIAILDTGVDPSIPGLTHTPDGATKVIDVQDFTGAGDVELEWVRYDAQKNALIRHDDDGNPIEYPAPEVPPTPELRTRYWWFGTLAEHKFAHADLSDLNDNDETDDEFAVLVSALKGDDDDHALCWVDTDQDRSFADEKALRNYKLEYDTFTLHREHPEKQIEPVTLAVNMFLSQRKAVFHFDEGAHGTHVAGIAAGYQINQQPHFHGVAPGARLMSLKIGGGHLAGISVTESMKKAIRYAAKYARDHDVPVVCNMSYGVESEIEGNADVDQMFDEVLRENPYLVFCTSAGNEGPGLSSVGTPAAAHEAITVAALMAADSARDVAGWDMERATVALFSSRGGELDKPDLATPGWSTSTVPRWVQDRDFWPGTSMASPYAAGLCALLISHTLQHEPGAHVRAADVKRALCLSGEGLPGFGVLDVGYGVPQMPQAAELLERIRATFGQDAVMSYEISTACATGSVDTAPAAYWRTRWLPTDEPQRFDISPVFMPTTDMNERTQFSREYELRSRSSWCTVQQESVYLRGMQDTSVYVEYDVDELDEPGLYTGVVEAISDGLLAFRLVNSLIVPYEFTAEENYTRTWTDQQTDGWTPRRYFLAVPPGASSMRVVLSAPEGEDSRAAFDGVFNPRGIQHGRFSMLDTNNGRREVELVVDDELTRGVWEVPILSRRGDKQWPYELAVRFFGLQAEPAEITSGSKTKPAGELTVTNMFNEPLPGVCEGEIEGFRLHKEEEFAGLDDELSYSISMDDRCNRVRLKLEMTPAAYATTTDIAVLVTDASGEALLETAFSHRKFERTFSTRGQKSLTVKIHAGFTHADPERETPIDVNIDQLLNSGVSLNVEHGNARNVRFIPGAAVTLSYSAGGGLSDPPADTHPVGYIRVKDRETDAVALHVPVDMRD